MSKLKVIAHACRGGSVGYNNEKYSYKVPLKVFAQKLVGTANFWAKEGRRCARLSRFVILY